MSTALELRGVTRRFDGGTAVDALDLVAGSGELVTLLGPSGCGKSTTLRMVGGFERPDAGFVRFDGEDVTALPPERRRAAMVFQHYALFPNLDVEGNVGYALRLQGVGREVRAQRVAELLDLVGLTELRTRRPEQLSGGQQQRVAVARALAASPRLLLLDEPLSNLDATLRREMRVSLRALQQEAGVTTLWVTHDREEALAVSDRLAVLRDGRLEQTGTPRELCEAPATAFVAEFLLEANRLTAELAARWFGASAGSSDAALTVRPDRVELVLDPAGALVVRSVQYGPTRTEVSCVDRERPELPPLRVSLDSRRMPEDLVIGAVVRAGAADSDLREYRGEGPG